MNCALASLTLLCMLPLGAAPAAEADVEHFDAQKASIDLPGGEKFAYVDVGPRDAATLVLIHGYTDSARDWAPIAPYLAARFRLIIVDLRGHGASGKPQCCYTRFDFAYDIKLLLEALHVGKADVAGHSLGSIVAQTFAELWPDLTHHLVLISSTGTSFGPAGPAAANWLASLSELSDPIDPDSAFMRDWWKESRTFNPPDFVGRQRRDAAAIPAQVWRAIADQSLVHVDLRSMLPRIKAPTLLIWGGRDALVSGAGRRALQVGIPHAQVRSFASLGHDLFWEDPPAVAGVISAFLVN